MACGGKGTAPEPQSSVESEIDAAKVSSDTGVKVTILKAESIGVATVHRFYWIRVEGRPSREKLLETSKAVIDQVIAAKPATYHAFTLHFISSMDMKASYAKTTFLPEGDWQKVGRVPIDGYGAYELSCQIDGPR